QQGNNGQRRGRRSYVQTHADGPEGARSFRLAPTVELSEEPDRGVGSPGVEEDEHQRGNRDHDGGQPVPGRTQEARDHYPLDDGRYRSDDLRRPERTDVSHEHRALDRALDLSGHLHQPMPSMIPTTES